jgi:acyl dehydratase
MHERAISYDDVIPGYRFPPATYELSQSFISKYLKAVDGAGDGFVPPLAITALAIAAMAQSIPLPPGIAAIHASQDVEFLSPVPVGATVECHMVVVQKIARGKMTMLVVELEVFDQVKTRVQSGKATVALLS